MRGEGESRRQRLDRISERSITSETERHQREEEEQRRGCPSMQGQKKYLIVATLACFLLLVAVGAPLIVWKISSNNDHSSNVLSTGAKDTALICGPVRVVQQSYKVTFQGPPSALSHLFTSAQDEAHTSFWQETWDRIIRASSSFPNTHMSEHSGGGCDPTVQRNVSLALVLPNNGDANWEDLSSRKGIPLLQDNSSASSSFEAEEETPITFVIAFAMNISLYSNLTLPKLDKAFALLALDNELNEERIIATALAVQEERENNYDKAGDDEDNNSNRNLR